MGEVDLCIYYYPIVISQLTYGLRAFRQNPLDGLECHSSKLNETKFRVKKTEVLHTGDLSPYILFRRAVQRTYRLSVQRSSLTQGQGNRYVRRSSSSELCMRKTIAIAV